MESLHLVEREFLQNLAHHHILPIATAEGCSIPPFMRPWRSKRRRNEAAGDDPGAGAPGLDDGGPGLRPAGGVRVAKAPPAEGGSTTDAAPSAAKEPEE
jgi:hypothetical protein